MQVWKVYCDKCGKQIYNNSNVLTIAPTSSPIESKYELCDNCTKQLTNEFFEIRNTISKEENKKDVN